MLEIRIEGKQPIYEQIVSGISGLISSGVLKPDEHLPAVREVAKQLGINPNTVQKAYMLLEQQGLIYSIPAKGSYVSADGAAADAVKRQAAEKLGSEIRAALKAGLTREEIIALLDREGEKL